MGKILIYGMQGGLGGVERYVLNLSAFLEHPAAHYGYVILGDKTVYEEELKFLGVDYYFVTHKNVSWIRNTIEFNRLLKKLKPTYDTIYFNTSGLYYPIPYILALKEGYRIILHSHLTESRNYKRFLHLFNRYWINKFTTKRLACSTPAAEWMFGRLKGTAQIIPNAIDLEKFRFNKEFRWKHRAALNISDDTILIGNIGRLSQCKNQKFLLEILAECKSMKAPVKLLLVGDGEEADKLNSLAKQLQITDKVIFWGKSSAPEELMSAMDCVVMPSFVEGFPVTLVEAQASGLPCFVSTVITKEVNVSEKVQFISLKEDANVWANCILRTNLQRYECVELLRKKGYEVRDLAKSLCELLHEEGAK